MKKIVMTCSLAASICLGACAQKIDGSKVPAAVSSSFQKHYPEVKVTWEMEDGKYEAGFTKDGQSTSVLYDASGVVTETETDIRISDLPGSVQAYVKKHYPGKKIKEAAKIVKADGTLTYEAEVNSKDVLFDATGKFIKEVKD